MKVEVKEGEKRSKYPYIGESTNATGLLVMFTAACTGVVLSAGNGAHEVGRFMDYWSEETFAPFIGSVTLSN